MHFCLIQSAEPSTTSPEAMAQNRYLTCLRTCRVKWGSSRYFRTSSPVTINKVWLTNAPRADAGAYTERYISRADHTLCFAIVTRALRRKMMHLCRIRENGLLVMYGEAVKTTKYCIDCLGTGLRVTQSGVASNRETKYMRCQGSKSQPCGVRWSISDERKGCC